MRTKQWKLIVGAFATSVALSIAAQSYAQTPVPASPTPERTQNNLVTLPNVGKVSSPGVVLSLDATTDEKKGSVALAFANADDSLTYGITATGPLDKSTGEAQPISLEGLPSSAVVEFGLNWFKWPGSPSPIAIRNFCLERTGKPECDDNTLSEKDRPDYLAITYADRNPWIVSASASIGRTEFRYVTRADLAPGTEQHNDGAVSFSIGQYAPLRGYIALGYEYQQFWQPAGSPRQICVPLATLISGTEECKSVIIGSPRNARAHLAKIQWRKFFRAGRLAINPNLIQDFEDDVTAVNMPVYFFTNANGGLAGGARVSWRSDNKNLTFTIFVGTVLSITD